MAGTGGLLDDVCDSPVSIDAQGDSFVYPSSTELRRGGSLKSRKETMGNGSGSPGSTAGLSCSTARVFESRFKHQRRARIHWRRIRGSCVKGTKREPERRNWAGSTMVEQPRAEGTIQERRKLDYRWWEVDELPAEDVSALLPRPTLPPRPPRPKPPPTNSHTLTQLLKLPSESSATASWTAVIHLTSSSQTASTYLSPLLASLNRQAPSPPSRILILVAQGMEPSASATSPYRNILSTVTYTSPQPPILALAQAAQSTIPSDYLLFIDAYLPVQGRSEFLSKDYVWTLLHASGTREYGSSLLTAGGVAISSSPSFDTRCVYPTSHTERIAVPSLPFLLPTSWLLPRDPSRPDATSVLQGLSTSLPIEVALSAALWTKHAIPIYAIPFPSFEDGDTASCDRLRRNLDAFPAQKQLFAPHYGAGEGLRRIQASGDRKKGGVKSGREKTLLERAEDERSRLLQTGTAVLLLSGEEELEAVRKMACRFAARAGDARLAATGDGDDDEAPRRPVQDFKIVIADYDTSTSSSSSLSDSDSPACHLDLTPLGPTPSSTSSSSSEPISLALLDLLDSLLPSPGFILYMSDGPRAREYEEVLRWIGGRFGPRKGGERLGRARAEREMLKGVVGAEEAAGTGRGRPTVVGMAKEAARRAEWIGALDLEALRHFHTPRIDLSVVTNDRPVSLHRLLSSLQNAYYFGDDISLTVNLEQTADRLTHRLVDDMRWPFGTFSLRHRILLGGLMPAIVESWYPTSNDTYGVLLEDDVEVSPLFYGWLKFAILQYRYTLAGRRSSGRLFGISLYQQKNIELRPEGRQPFDAHKLFADLSLHSTTPYLSQIPCSWGAAYFPEHWREFHTYLSLRLSELALPISEPLVPAIRSNKWPRSWKKYFIELVYLRGYSMLYPNYPDFESLSTNHLEKGTHVHTARVDDKKKATFEVPLLDRDASLVDTLPGGPGHERLPDWDALPVMDLWGSLASADELLERGWQTTRMTGSCPVDRLPDLSNGGSRPRYDARELLCPRLWDRETQGRLVDAQPLTGRAAVDVDRGRAVAAAAGEVEIDGPEHVRRAELAAGIEAGTASEEATLADRLARARADYDHERDAIGEGEADNADASTRGALFEEVEDEAGQ
ncbi:glycosyltransferase 2 [Rhodotorula toruloides]|uniref:Glycosyltransferase 2 n=1 Tax=Rhodotorula toruloides TaxID=5286 RepID=A0A511KLU8_RHOTO|nr:glycosyltransferase 2 [Rhodotorula toruloides]